MFAPNDRRKSQRFTADERVLFVQNGVRYDGTLSDISRGGAFLQTRKVPETGSRVDLTLRASTDAPTFVLASGRVVRTLADPAKPSERWGFGIQWTQLRSTGGADAIERLFGRFNRSIDDIMGPARKSLLVDRPFHRKKAQFIRRRKISTHIERKKGVARLRDSKFT